MVMIMVERVTPSIRGELTRWLCQPRTGVFVGKVSALVRDKLWDRVVRSMASLKPRKSGRKPGAMMIYATNNEQGFALRVRIVEWNRYAPGQVARHGPFRKPFRLYPPQRLIERNWTPPGTTYFGIALAPKPGRKLCLHLIKTQVPVNRLAQLGLGTGQQTNRID